MELAKEPRWFSKKTFRNIAAPSKTRVLNILPQYVYSMPPPHDLPHRNDCVLCTLRGDVSDDLSTIIDQKHLYTHLNFLFYSLRRTFR